MTKITQYWRFYSDFSHLELDLELVPFTGTAVFSDRVAPVRGPYNLQPKQLALLWVAVDLGPAPLFWVVLARCLGFEEFWIPRSLQNHDCNLLVMLLWPTTKPLELGLRCILADKICLSGPFSTTAPGFCAPLGLQDSRVTP